MNNKERDLRKAAEECSELVTVLIQQLNKPHKDFTATIIEEAGDVLFRVEKLKYWYNPALIEERVELKKNKEILKLNKK